MPDPPSGVIATEGIGKTKVIRIGSKFAVTDEEANQLIRETSKVHRNEFDCTAQEGEYILHWLNRCAATEGAISPAEKLILGRMGKALGMTEAGIVAAAQPATSNERITFLDTDAALSLFRTMPLKDVCAWDGAPPEVVAQVREQLGMSAEERPLAVFCRKSWIMSGGHRTVSSAVLTNQSLYFTSAPSMLDIRKGYVPVNRIPLESIKEAGGGIAFVGVTLKDGKRLKVDRAMKKSLKLVEQVRKTCLRCA